MDELKRDDVKLEGLWEILEQYSLEPKLYGEMQEHDWDFLWAFFVKVRML